MTSLRLADSLLHKGQAMTENTKEPMLPLLNDPHANRNTQQDEGFTRFKDNSSAQPSLPYPGMEPQKKPQGGFPEDAAGAEVEPVPGEED